MELWIRPGRQDHRVLDRVTAPAAAGIATLRPTTVSGIVVDATVAHGQPRHSQIATAAGIPFVVDPVTPVLQRPVSDESPWQQIPYVGTTDWDVRRPPSPAQLTALVERSSDFQRAHGATFIVPPYFYAQSPADPWFQASLDALSVTRDHLHAERVSLPVLPVFAGAIAGFGPRASWIGGLDRFLEAARQLELHAVALSWSSASMPKARYATLLHLLNATAHASGIAPTISWRQGLYGLATVAAGASGYESGIGMGESLHYPAYLRRHATPRATGGHDDSPGPRGTAYVYLSAFGRSVPRATGRALLTDPITLGQLVCDAPVQCCPDGAEAMTRQWREHAIRSRARELQELAAMPSAPAWRLKMISDAAGRAAVTAASANEVLAEQNIVARIPVDTFTELGSAASSMRHARQDDVA